MKDKMKIHCLESQKEEFDKTSFEDLQKMVGWIEPPDKTDEFWDVTMADGSSFECKDQSTAQIISSLEEIKAILMSK